MGLLTNLAGRLVVPVASFVLGGFAEWVRGRLRRYREIKAIEIGQRFNAIEFLQIAIAAEDGKRWLHVQSLGSLPLSVFMPNEAARRHLLQLAKLSEKDVYRSVIPMQGALGSFVLRELNGLLRMLAPKSGFPLRRWLMVPVLENYQAFEFATPTVLLVRPDDLAIFKTFAECRDLLVLHGSDGGKVLTLMEVHAAFEQQKQRLCSAREQGRSTRDLEEMWIVYLRLDDQTPSPTPAAAAAGEEKGFRPIPWERFSKELAVMGLQS